MSVRKIYYPQGVCSQLIEIELSDDGATIEKVQFVGGCHGNTQGVCRLAEGRPVAEVVALLSGIDCRGRGTSCPDQLARALSKIEG